MGMKTPQSALYRAIIAFILILASMLVTVNNAVTTAATPVEKTEWPLSTFTPTPEGAGDGSFDVLATLTAMVAPTSQYPTQTPGAQTAISKDGHPHFVDFNATWCEPCNEMRPALSRLKAKYAGKVTFDSFDIDEETSFDVMARYYPIGTIIPYMLLLDKDLKVVQKLNGGFSPYFSEKDLDNYLNTLYQTNDQPDATVTP